jgi:co-chaperonin GroES (HSP10)
MLQNTYQAKSKLDKNSWITPPNEPDPENLPVPLGFLLLVRPYPVITNREKTTLIIPDEEFDFLNYVTNIGRVVAIGDCCWNREEHRMKDGTKKDWVQVGDFISYPKNTGARRKFKGVSYVVLTDEEVNERLPDPQIFDNSYYKLDIPEEHMLKYNTYKKGKE